MEQNEIALLEFLHRYTHLFFHCLSKSRHHGEPYTELQGREDWSNMQSQLELNDHYAV